MLLTYTEKLEAQIEFAKSRMAEVSNHISHGTWDGYIQGLRYALAELPEKKGDSTDAFEQEESLLSSCPLPNECLYPNCKCWPVEKDACKKQCTCSATDLQPFGECVCSESKVAPI